ncbi:hypothetical protein ACA358_13930, partial [Enterococcus faecium]|uniref:hypothetical protein n=1 Tax=Enterococcus faecium TaxID=1352 RepID=UPI003BA23A2C
VIPPAIFFYYSTLFDSRFKTLQQNHEIDNYADFLMICINHSDDWFDVEINYNTLAINKMIDGMWLKKKNELK